MKHKHLKINEATLFVYRNRANTKRSLSTEPTDPTTTMITITKTGDYHAGRAS